MSEEIDGFVYLDLDDFHRLATQVLGVDDETVASVTDDALAGSELAAPAAGFGGEEKYPDLATKVAVLLRAVAANHSLPDGNKRCGLLCAILFADLNRQQWIAPASDAATGGEETEHIVVQAAQRGAELITLEELTSWVSDRLVPIDPPPEPWIRVIEVDE